MLTREEKGPLNESFQYGVVSDVILLCKGFCV